MLRMIQRRLSHLLALCCRSPYLPSTSNESYRCSFSHSSDNTNSPVLDWSSIAAEASAFKTPPSAKEIISFERPFVRAPCIQIPLPVKDNACIIWQIPNDPKLSMDLSTNLKFRSDANFYYKQVKPVYYALAQGLHLGLSHVIIYSGSSVVVNVANEKFKAAKMIPEFLTMRRMIKAEDAPIKCRIENLTGVKLPRPSPTITEEDFAEKFRASIDKLKTM